MWFDPGYEQSNPFLPQPEPELTPEELAELGLLQQDPAQRYATDSPAPVNPVSLQSPQAGGKQLPAQNGALARLLKQMPRTQGKRIIPGLKDNSDPHASGMNWHESGGV